MNGGRMLELARQTGIAVTTHASEQFERRTEQGRELIPALFRGAEKRSLHELMLKRFMQRSPERTGIQYFETSVGDTAIVFVVQDRGRDPERNDSSFQYVIITIFAEEDKACPRSRATTAAT